MSQRILIIDDEEAIRHSIKIYFECLGYAVDMASSLEEAEDLVLDVAYDLVMSDLRLTRTSGPEGLDIIRFIRENSPRTATVILTAYGSPDIEKEAQKLGVDRFIHKPLPLSELADEISVLLSQSAKHILES